MRRAVALLSLLGACGGTPKAREATAKPAGPSIPRAYRALAARVEAARELAFVRDLDVRALDEESFLKALDEHGSPPPADLVDPTFRWVFGYAKERPTRWPAQVADGVSALGKEQTLAFYDCDRRAVFARIKQEPGAEDELESTLAHELAHALVDDHTTLLREQDDVTTQDRSLAVAALVEGDATVTAALARERAPNEDVASVLHRLAKEAASSTLASLDTVALPAVGRALRDASPIERERLLFPYRAGTFFIAQLWRAGGTRLVDAVLDAPPATTSAILHPERWIAGERPRAIAAPTLPDRVEHVSTGMMGELAMRVFLSRFMPVEDANDATSGWNGDAYAVGLDGTAPVVVWVSAFRDEVAAVRFAHALERSAACATSGGCAPGEPPRVRVSGASVLYVRGATDDVGEAALAGVGPPLAPAPSFGEVVLPPTLDAPELGRAELGDTCVRDDVGVRVALPPGWGFSEARRDRCDATALVGDGRVSFHRLEQAPGSIDFDAVDRYVTVQLRASFHRVEPTRIHRTTLLGAGRGKRFRVDGPVEIESVYLPVCGAQKTLQVTARWSNEATRAGVERVVARLGPASAALAAGCSRPSP